MQYVHTEANVLESYRQRLDTEITLIIQQAHRKHSTATTEQTFTIQNALKMLAITLS